MNTAALLLDLTTSPGQAMSAIAEKPRWVLASALLVVVSMAAGFLFEPALQHVVANMARDQAAQNPRSGRAVYIMATFSLYLAVFGAPFTALIGALILAAVLLLASKPLRGTASFAQMFSLVVNIALLFACIDALVSFVILKMRGIDSFNTMRDITTMIPSLGSLVPPAQTRLVALLSDVNPLTIWQYCLIALGLTGVASLSKTHAAAIAAGVLLLSACLGAIFA